MAKKHSRRHGSRKHRTHRRRQRGGESSPALVGGDSMKEMSQQSLAQGQQFANMHANQHGGGNLDAGGYPNVLDGQPLLTGSMADSARVSSLDAAIKAVQGLRDPGQVGGRRRKGRKASKKARKASRKGRKASRKGRKASRKGRKASRKSRKTRRQRGGSAYDSNPASVDAPGMLLPPAQMRAALSGMSSEWRLATDPKAFAPGVN